MEVQTFKPRWSRSKPHTPILSVLSVCVHVHGSMHSKILVILHRHDFCLLCSAFLCFYDFSNEHAFLLRLYPVIIWLLGTRKDSRGGRKWQTEFSLIFPLWARRSGLLTLCHRKSLYMPLYIKQEINVLRHVKPPPRNTCSMNAGPFSLAYLLEHTDSGSGILILTNT